MVHMGASHDRSIDVKGLGAVGDSLLHIGIYCISRASQVFHKGSKKVEIAGRDRLLVGWFNRNVLQIYQPVW